jgi:uncharacterized membrane protein
LCLAQAGYSVALEALSQLLHGICTRATLAAVTRSPRDQREPGKPMRRLLLIVGLIALAIGLLWMGQGTGVIQWPESSFMISQIQWAEYGAALAVLGLILILQSRR